jgi:type IV pilus assembly protein PilY1
MTTQANKDALLDEVFQVNSTGGTPLRSLLENVGKYFDDTDGAADHSALGFTDGTPIAAQADGGECQQNFTVLMSDGFWNGIDPAVGNTDGDDNTIFDGGPHADAISNTLADVAMKYFEEDLSLMDDQVPDSTYTDPTNGVTYTDDNPAQHLATYTVGFGLTGSGLTTPADHDAATAAPPWTTPVANTSTTLDDMQHAAFNGRGAFLNASDAPGLVDSLNEALADIDQRTSISGSAIAINSTVLKTTSRIFQASFSSVDWTGELSAFSLNSDGTINTEEWAATDKYSTVTDPDDRDIFTSVSTGGIEFDDNPANAELNTAIGTLTVGATTYTASDLIHYIHGH